MKKLFTIRNLKRLAGLAAIVMVLFYAFGPLNPADLRKIEVTSTGPYFIGSEVNYRSTFCRYASSNIRSDILRSLVPVNRPDLIPIPVTTDSVANPARCVDRLPRTFVIPPTVIAGVCYTLKSQSLYYYPLRPEPIERVVIGDKKICVQMETPQQRIDRLEDEIEKAERDAAAVTTPPTTDNIAAIESAPNTVETQTQTSSGSIPTTDSQQVAGTNGGGSSETPPPNPRPGVIESIPILGPILSPILKPITDAL